LEILAQEQVLYLVVVMEEVVLDQAHLAMEQMLLITKAAAEVVALVVVLQVEMVDLVW
jgi:hypothetical protein